MFDVKRFIEKLQQNIPLDNITILLGRLPKDSTLNIISENAGSIGDIIKIILEITEKLYDSKVPADRRLSITLMRIMLESAKCSLPYLVSNTKVKDIVNGNKNSFGKDFG